MQRISMTEDPGSWFDLDASVRLGERSIHDGNNFISCATGSQWHHEALHHTASGNWVLHWWSQYQGPLDRYERIEEAAAVNWLSAQHCEQHENFEELPERIRALIESGIKAREL